ncbi:MAG TPA: chemotaxis protein CheW [Clostridia bacterium]|nr:chemotaxis protein CheW [Clostridia bacterium]
MAELKENVTTLEEDTQHGKYLTFLLGEDVFGIEIKYVTEIIGIQPITPVPNVPPFVKGIINLRGKIIPVIDVRVKFGKETVEYDDRTCIIVLETGEIAVGFIVDNVAEVLNISDENIVPPPDYRTGYQNKYIKGIGKAGDEVKLLIDCEKLLDTEQF